MTSWSSRQKQVHAALPLASRRNRGATSSPLSKQAAPGQMRFTTIQSFKGLDSPAIVVTDIEHLAGEHFSSLFYVATTRALERLCIIVHETAKPTLSRPGGNQVRVETGEWKWPIILRIVTLFSRHSARNLSGACPLGQEIDCTAAIQLDDAEAAYRPYRQLGIWRRDSTAGFAHEALRRRCPVSDGGSRKLRRSWRLSFLHLMTRPRLTQPENVPRDTNRVLRFMTARKLPPVLNTAYPDAETDDFDLSSANAYKPSSMAVSLLVRLPDGAELVVTATGGRYAIKPVMLTGASASGGSVPRSG